jgi:hypothetical protein
MQRSLNVFFTLIVLLSASLQKSTSFSPRTTTSNVELAAATMSDTTTDTAAPLYITIGPQCCGKSTILKALHGGTIKDICLDDQQDVYVPVATDVFCNPETEEIYLQQQVYQGKSLKDRIQNDNVELHLVLRRWKGDLTPIDFETAVKEFYNAQNFPPTVATAMVTAVESFLKRRKAQSGPRSLPKTVDVFVLESLFRPHPQTNQSAIQKAHDELRTTPTNIPIAWGNTNSKSRDFSQALDIASQIKRPVRFVLCHPNIQKERDNDDDDASLITLPWVELPELLGRNLKRLKKTGRYIPAFAIADCSQRVTTLLTAEDHDTEDRAVEKKLVSLASPLPPPSKQNSNGRGNGRGNLRHQNQPPIFKFVMNEQGLIEKIFIDKNKQQASHVGRKGKVSAQNSASQGESVLGTQRSPWKRPFNGEATKPPESNKSAK